MNNNWLCRGEPSVISGGMFNISTSADHCEDDVRGILGTEFFFGFGYVRKVINDDQTGLTIRSWTWILCDMMQTEGILKLDSQIYLDKSLIFRERLDLNVCAQWVAFKKNHPRIDMQQVP